MMSNVALMERDEADAIAKELNDTEPGMFEQLDAFKLYAAFLTLMSEIDLCSTDNLRRVHEEIVLRSGYEYEDEHLVRMARGIINALDAEIASRGSVPNAQISGGTPSAESDC